MKFKLVSTKKGTMSFTYNRLNSLAIDYSDFMTEYK